MCVCVCVCVCVCGCVCGCLEFGESKERGKEVENIENREERR